MQEIAATVRIQNACISISYKLVLECRKHHVSDLHPQMKCFTTYYQIRLCSINILTH